MSKAEKLLSEALDFPPPGTEFTGPNPKSDFRLVKILGKGAVGTVYAGIHKKTNSKVAVKVIYCEDCRLDDSLKESETMASLHHSNIVAFFGSYILPQQLWIIMEFCPYKNIAKVIETLGHGLPDNAVICIVRQMSKALDYIHSKGILHRDIKASNLLLNPNGIIKLCDFGTVAAVNAQVTQRSTIIGTPYWMAPEIVEGCKYDFRADVWSLGITVIELVDEYPPLYDRTAMQALFLIPSNPPPTVACPEKHDPVISSFIAKCLVKDQEKRPLMSEVVKHSLITERAEHCRSWYAVNDTNGDDIPADAPECSLMKIIRSSGLQLSAERKSEGVDEADSLLDPECVPLTHRKSLTAASLKQALDIDDDLSDKNEPVNENDDFDFDKAMRELNIGGNDDESFIGTPLGSDDMTEESSFFDSCSFDDCEFKQNDEKKENKKETINLDDLQADLDSLAGLGTINDGDFRDDLSLDFQFQDGGKGTKEDDDKVLSELSELDLILEENSRTPSPSSTFTRKQASELKVPSVPSPCSNCESLKEKQTALEIRKEELKKSILQTKESTAMLKGQLSMIDAMFAALPPFP